MTVVVGTYAIGLAVPGGFNLIVAGAMGVFAEWLPALVCWMAFFRAKPRRLSLLLAALSLTSFTCGSNYFLLFLSTDDTVAFPSPADAGYLLFYPLMLGALVTMMHAQSHRLSASLWLDSALGALGAATVLAVVLSPIVDSALQGPPTLATVVALAVPMSDLVLVAVVAGIATSQGLTAGRLWWVLVVGLLAFAATDISYSLRITSGTYLIGNPLDAGWGVGMALIAFWMHGTSRGDRSMSLGRIPTTALAVPAAATTAGVGVLVLATLVDVSGLAVAFASITLVAAAARTQLAFRQLVGMAQLQRQTRTDDLTGLPNRRALYADVPLLLAGEQGPKALLLLDLDRFKEVNDSLGHHVGDRLLVNVGSRLSEQLRQGDMLARLGGDEFALLLEGADHDGAVAMAVKLRLALARPFTLEGIALQTDVSIGIALFPDQGLDLSSLLRRADMAMYQAKTTRSGHRVYAGSDDTQGDARLRTLDELRTALVADQLVVHYQPKVDLATAAVRSVEALVRWDHPTRGLVYPDRFLGLIEDAGLMRDLTVVVLEKSLDQAKLWKEQGTPLKVAVNMSASSLVDLEFPDQVTAMIAGRGLTPDCLMLEITEEFLMADRKRASGILVRLRDAGIQIAVDDFGTGYSSLAYLRDLPIDELKLDQSFVFPIADDARAAALVASTVALAHSLGLRMVAEGVESDVAYRELARMGCDQAQGYFFSRPVAAVELDMWLAARVPLTVAG